jgi:diguanylate cyclase (GGDEF)-like protein/PAS domain S-box-containing protein
VAALPLWVRLPPGVDFLSLLLFHVFAASISWRANRVGHRNRRQLAQQTAALAESEQRFRKIFEAGGIGIALVDLDFRLVTANEALGALLGYAPAELSGRTVGELTHPEDLASDMALAQKLAAGEIGSYQLKKRFVRRDGQVVWANLTGSVIRDAQGKALYFVGMLEDIMAREQAEAALKAANDQLTVWLEALGQRTREISLLQALGSRLQTCRSLPEAYRAMGEVGADLFPGAAGALYALEPGGQDMLPVAVWNQTAPAWPLRAADCRAMRNARQPELEAEGECQACGVSGGQTNRPLCVVVVDRETPLGVLRLAPPAGAAGDDAADAAADRERLARAAAESLGLAWGSLRLHASLREQSVRDPLTGLFNRRYVEATVERELHRAERQRHGLGVLVLDLDHFKKFNDAYGHPAGDALLRVLGRYINSTTRAGDIAGRLGGEEFCVILPDSTLAATRQRAERLRRGLHQLSFEHDGRELGGITLSIGVSTYPEHGSDWPALFEAADRALYQAKAAGRDRVVVAAGEPDTS